MIRRIFLASAGALALAGTAFAADLAPPPPVFLPPPPLWTGFYAGVNAGYEWSASNSVDVVSAVAFNNFAALLSALGSSYAPAAALGATRNIPLNSNGFIGGGQIGYNYQFATSWLVGIEADIEGIAGGNGSASVFTVTPESFAGPLPAATVQTTDHRLEEPQLSRHRAWPVRLSRDADPADLWRWRSCLWRDQFRHRHLRGRSSQHRVDAFLWARPGLDDSGRLDGRRRRRMDVPSQLERQGRICLLRPRQRDLQRWSADCQLEWRRSCYLHKHRGNPDPFQRQHRPRRNQLPLQLGRACSGRRQILKPAIGKIILWQNQTRPRGRVFCVLGRDIVSATFRCVFATVFKIKHRGRNYY